MAAIHSPGKKKFFRYALIVGGLLFALAVSAVFAGYAVKNARRVRHYRNAVAVYDQGDYAQAEGLLLNCLREDRNAENAWVKLAELYEKQKRWRGAARCWRFAASLNSLNGDYTRSYIAALLHAREFRQLIEVISRLPGDRKNSFTPVLALAEVMTGKPTPAKALLAKLPSGSDDELTRWVRFMVDNPPPSSAGKESAWDRQCRTFARSADAVVAFEACGQIFALATLRKDWPEAEKYLGRMVELNPEYALPVQGDFYYDLGRYQDAYRVYREAMTTGLPRDAVMRYADVLFFLGKLDDLKKLAPAFRQGNREIMLCGFYIDALIASMEKNSEALGQSLKQLDASVKSRLAVILRFDYGLQTADVPMLLAAYKEIVSRNDLKSYEPVAWERVQPFLLKFYRERKIAAVAPLAQWLYMFRKDNLLLDRIVFLYQGMTGTILYGELNAALRKFPKDPVLLTVAVDYWLGKGNFASALPLAERNIAAGNDTVYAALQEMMALDGAGRADEARKKYAELRKKYPDNPDILKRYLAFCLQQNRPLPELGDRPEFQALRPLWTGEQAIREKHPEQMVEAFSSPALLQALDASRPENQAILYYMAMRLAGADALQPAIAIYEKLEPEVVNPTLIRMNLSELYAAAGDKTAALAEARKAWLEHGSVPEVQACYGLRQLESGNYGEALKLLNPLIGKLPDDPRILPAWVKTLETLIATSYRAGQYDDSRKYCDWLLRGAPGNAVARDYDARLRAAAARTGGH